MHSKRACLMRLQAVVLTFLAAGTLIAAETNLLLHWSFDENGGATTADRSGNGLNGRVTAQWVSSPSGGAMLLDEAPSNGVSVEVPEGQRFGTNSWTFLAWLKPTGLATAAPASRASLFSCGAVSEATMTISVTGSGNLAPSLSYLAPTGRVAAERATSLQTLRTGEWAHAAVVCDRSAGRFWCFINGYAGTSTDLPAGFAGDFSSGGLLSIGGATNSYRGLVDDVRIFRRLLSKAEIRGDFERGRPAFSPPVPKAILAAGQREVLAEALAAAGQLWAAENYAAVREHCAAIAADTSATSQARSLAHLRVARSFMAQGDATAARAEYERIAGNASYPAVHRDEARECASEMERESRGLPRRDPSASRTRVPPAGTFAAEFFVGPRGDDANDGSRSRPFATVTRARDAVRAFKAGRTRGAIAVTVMPGEYKVRETLALSREDSGTAEAPVVFRAEQKGRAVFYGGAGSTASRR
jgi:hypothetical protein